MSATVSIARTFGFRAKTALASLLVCAVAGCAFPAKYHLPGHATAIKRKAPTNSGIELPALQMRTGDTLDVVRPERVYGPSGYWTALWIEDASLIETHQWTWADNPRITRIKALRPGRTRAFYTNRVYLAGDVVREERRPLIMNGNWFWIEVAPASGDEAKLQ